MISHEDTWMIEEKVQPRVRLSTKHVVSEIHGGRLYRGERVKRIEWGTRTLRTNDDILMR